MTRIADPQTLALHEALMIDGGWDQYSDQELARQLPPTVRPARLKDQLANGELVLLRDTPSIPLFQVVAGRVVRSESPSGAINPLAADALGIRFGDRDFAARAPGYGQSDSLPPAPALAYTPEPPVPEPPPKTFPPVAVISENFALPPLGPKVFAKSCTRPNGDTDSNEGEEKASNFGALALFATANASGASALRPLDLVAGSSMRLTEGRAMAMRLGASVLTSAAGVALLALWPAKLGDGTLYTEEELRAISEAAIRVRFHLHMDESGTLRVSGYHANHGTGYGDTVPVVQATSVGEHFEAVVDNDVTLVWYPDESGYRPVETTEYPADSGVNPHRILVTPIREEGQEAITPGNYERPFEDQIERIVSFPADSGIVPLYLVFQKRAGGRGHLISISDEMTVSRIVPGGGLQTHENAKGHLLLKHVGHNEQALIKRLESEPKISGSSSFHDRASAEYVVSSAIETHQDKIKDWLNGTAGRLKLEHTLPEPTGISLSRGSDNAVAVKSVRVILQRDSSMSIGYKILTGFPTTP